MLKNIKKFVLTKKYKHYTDMCELYHKNLRENIELGEDQKAAYWIERGDEFYEKKEQVMNKLMKLA